jgi:surface antigen
VTRKPLLPLVTAVVVLCSAGSAQAQGTATGTVTVNAGYTLTVRAAPKSDAEKVRQLANGAKVVIVCQTNGDKVTGKFGTTRIWDQLKGGGYVSDSYIYTGSDGRVAKDCGAAPAPAPTPAPAPAPAPAPTPAPAPAPPPPSGGTPADVALRNDYPYKNASWDAVDPWGFYKRECTSFVAWRLNKLLKFSNGMRGGRFGNAITWDDNARRLGIKVDRKPTPGSVMVRNSGTYGHVAIVAKTRKGGVYVEQYNAGGTHKYSQQWLTITSAMTFIHFK